MKDALSGISIFQIVIVFILIFTGIMCLTINHAKAFGVKDEIINIIESEDITNVNDLNGLSPETATKIAEKLGDFGYRVDGNCPDSSWIGYKRDGSISYSGKAAFCIRANDLTKSIYNDLTNACHNNNCEAVIVGLPPMVYYDIALFYQLDIPLTTGLNFRIYGSTKTLIG